MVYILLAAATPLLLLGAFLLGWFLRRRHESLTGVSPVTYQHLELYRGGQLSEAAVESTKQRFSSWLERGDIARIEASMHAGTSYVVCVRALAEIGSEDACRILERQLRRRLTADQVEQAWYWIDLATSLRQLGREESLPSLIACAMEADDCPLIHYLAAEIVCFLGFSGYVQDTSSETGRSAIRILHRAFEGLRLGVSPHLVAEARLGEVVETVWDHRDPGVDPILVLLFSEVLRHHRRSEYLERLLVDDPADQEGFRLQMSRIAALTPHLEDYLEQAGPALLADLLTAPATTQGEILLAIDELRLDAGALLMKGLEEGALAYPELALLCLRWSRHPHAAEFLRTWRPSGHRGRPRSTNLRTEDRGSSTMGEEAVLLALRGHPGRLTERFLLNAALQGDSPCRIAAIRSLGWTEPTDRAAVIRFLRDARFDSCSEVRQAARAALARLGERQALQWYRQALHSEQPPRVLEAIHAIAQEGITLLWPELDAMLDQDDPEIAYCARQALFQMSEELDRRPGCR